MSAKRCAIFGVFCCVSFCLLTYSGGWFSALSSLLGGGIDFLVPTLTAFAAFFLPGAAFSSLTKGKNFRRTAPPSPSDLMVFTISVSLFFASLGFFIAYFYGFSYILPYAGAVTPPDDSPYFVWLIFGLIIPVVMEEYFLRGVFARRAARFGTTLAVAASSILYGMLQSSFTAFWGALISGALFCLISEFLATSLPIAAIRVVSIVYYRLLIGLVNTYTVYGLEYVFLLLNLIIMLISCYFLLLSIERFIKKGRKLRLRRIPQPVTKSISAFALNPGMLAFYVLYIMIVCDVI